MKTTLDINDALLADAKTMAVAQRTTLTRLIEEGLQLRMRAAQTSAATRKVALPVFHGKGGVLPGIDPVSNQSLFDAADDA